MENQEEGITLGQLFKVVFGRNKQRKILFLCLLVGITLFGILAIKLVYNTSKDTYTAQFNWTTVGLSDGKYVDGSTFNYKELQTSDVLNEVKDSNDEFSSISVENMLGDFTITYVTEKDDDDNVTNQYYQISVLKKYFKNKTQAADFIKAVADYPINENIEKLDSINLTSNLTNYSSSVVYDNQVTYLTNQYNLLVSYYDTLTSAYGDVQLSSGSTVSATKALLVAHFTDYTFSKLTLDISNYGYVKNYDYYESQIVSALDDELTSYQTNKAKYDALEDARDKLISQASSSSNLQDLQLESYNTEMVSLLEANKDLLVEMIVNLRKLARDTSAYANEEALEAAFSDIALIFNQNDSDTTNDDVTTDAFKSIYTALESAPSVETFESNITTYYYEPLVELTSTLKSVESEVVTNYSKTTFESGAIVVLDEEMSTATAVVASVLVGFVVACVVNFVIDIDHLHDEPAYRNLKKKENVEE